MLMRRVRLRLREKERRRMGWIQKKVKINNALLGQCLQEGHAMSVK